MSHILYLYDKKRVCEFPERLGNEYVITEPSVVRGLPSCKLCTTLLFAHNKNEFEKEHNRNFAISVESEKGLSLSRAVVLCLILSTVWWVVFFMVLNRLEG